MSVNENTYGLDPHVVEIYEQFETQTDDVCLLRRLLAGRGLRRIFEPFCGTGRILIPLACDGHALVGLDQAANMLDRARAKIAALPADVQRRITLIEGDAITDPWPTGFDVVLLGGNCFYELASPEEQERCIAQAARSLKPGGYVYVDNDHMEGDLHESWRHVGRRTTRFPTGTCADGTRVEGTIETIGCDVQRRIWRARRTITVTYPDGRTVSREWIQQKHPVSAHEVEGWLRAHGFAIEEFCGDRAGNPYTDASPRAIFWATKGEVPS